MTKRYKKIYLKTNGQGNMYYLNKYLLKNNTEYKIRYHDFRGISKLKYLFFQMQSRIEKYDLIISDYPTQVFSRSPKSILINHGYGTKKTPSIDELVNKTTMSVYKSMKDNLNYIVTLSEKDEHYFLNCEGLKNSKCSYLPLGLPRNDILFDKVFEKKAIEKCNKKWKEEIILYCPTWRRYSIEEYFQGEDLSKLNLYLLENNKRLIYKPHSLSGVIREEEVEKYSNITLLDSSENISLEELMIASNSLITDFSSIFVDYLLLDKPIYFLIPDLEKYRQDRGLEIDFNNPIETPGFKCESVNELTNILNLGVEDISIVLDKSKKYYHSYRDGNSCQRVSNLIDDILKEM